MKKYEDLIREYVEKNADTLNGKAPSKKRLIKFSEAISRAILERKKSDTGYGDLAESLAAAGLSDSGYAVYLKSRYDGSGLSEIKEAAEKKQHEEAVDTHEAELKAEMDRLAAEKAEKERLEKEEKDRLAAEKAEKERLEKEEKDRLAAEKAEAERAEKAEKERQKNKNTVASFAEANKVTDASVLYTYAISLGLSPDDAKEISDASAAKVKEALRAKNIEKAREYIVEQRFTYEQAYAYAEHLGLDENDAKELAEFAYRLNQDTESLFGDKYESVGGTPDTRLPEKPNKNLTNTIK